MKQYCSEHSARHQRKQSSLDKLGKKQFEISQLKIKKIFKQRVWLQNLYQQKSQKIGER